MAVLGRVAVLGLAAAGGWVAWRALREPESGVGQLAGAAGHATGAVAGAALDSARGSGAPADGGAGQAGGGTDQGGSAGAAAGGQGELTATGTALDGTVGAQREGLVTPSALGSDPAVGAEDEGAAGSPAAGTRSDDPLTGITAPAAELPEPTASPDGTPAAGPVETRRVGEDPA